MLSLPGSRHTLMHTLSIVDTTIEEQCSTDEAAIVNIPGMQADFKQV